MRAVICTLAKLALRHYRDPLSWAGAIAAVGAATHTAIPPEYIGYIETILGSLVGILLLMADGRKNPNTDSGTGAITERVPEQSTTVAVVVPMPAEPQSDVQSDSTGPKPPRPGFGPFFP